MTLKNSYCHNFEMKTDMKVKISPHTKVCTQNKILASKMQNIKQKKTFAFAPIILKR